MVRPMAILLITLSLASLLSLLLSLCCGSYAIAPLQIFQAILHPQHDTLHQILFQLRIPRTASAFITGALLAMSGAMMQALLRNPLADPYILGISGGAAVGALLCLSLGLSAAGVSAGAWVGSLTIIMFLHLIRQTTQAMHRETLLLTGIALTSIFSAIISCLFIVSHHHQVNSMLFWLMGDLSFSHPPIAESIILLLALLLSLRYMHPLNVLTLGHNEAQTLGIHCVKLQWQLYLLCGLMTATAISLAGCIGFIGLITPHLIRLMGGHDHRLLIPGSLLLGGSLLTTADTLSRSLFAFQQLPVGIVMTMIGVPGFLWLLYRQNTID